ncbi:MAG: family N-acetyltransferase [Frankiales bacterium]|nr:family N-acetyltransferase [Frankiales bacterium]
MVRDARPADARRFEEIRVAGWKAAYSGMVDDDFLASYAVEDERVVQRERWLADLPAGHVMLVAEAAGGVVGGAILTPSRDDDAPDAAELLALYIDPARRFSGVGSGLLTAGFARMPQLLQTLWVLEGNSPARRFYERHGFVPDGGHKLLELPGRPPEIRYRRPRLG